MKLTILCSIPFFPACAQEYQLLRLIDMSEVHTVASVELKRNEHCFGIVTPRRTYYVKSSSRADMLDWIERLNLVRTLLAQSTTMTQDLAKLDLGGAPAASRGQGQARAPITGGGAGGATTADEDSSAPGSVSGAPGGSSAVTQVAVPGIGVFHHPAQPRPIPATTPDGSATSAVGGDVLYSPATTTSSGSRGAGAGAGPGSRSPGAAAFSPLTATSDSESSEVAAKYGLSYASSFGGAAQQQQAQSGFAVSAAPAAAHERLSSGGGGGYSSANSLSGGDSGDGGRRHRSPGSSRRERSQASSGAGVEVQQQQQSQLLAPPIGIDSSGRNAGGAGAGAGASTGALSASVDTTGTGGGGALSSSEEEGEEDWDEDEGADQAMPLPALTPGGLNLASVHNEFIDQVALRNAQGDAAAGAGSQQQQQQQMQQQQLMLQRQQMQEREAQLQRQRQANTEFLKDPSRVLLQGYLMKQSNRRKHWRKRWFVLTSSKLMYTRSHMVSKDFVSVCSLPPVTSAYSLLTHTLRKPCPHVYRTRKRIGKSPSAPSSMRSSTSRRRSPGATARRPWPRRPRRARRSTSARSAMPARWSPPAMGKMAARHRLPLLESRAVLQAR